MKIIIILSLLLFVITGCGSSYKLENNHWVFTWWNEDSGTNVRIVKNADKESFKILKKTEYAKDKNRVYYRGLEIRNADSKSFVYIDDYYSKDINHVFLRDKELTSIDPLTFEIIKWEWSKDKNDIYSHNKGIGVKDIDSFQFINIDWGKDRISYYYIGGWTDIGSVDADYNSFKIINSSNYAIDKNQAFYERMPINNSSPKTFKVLNLCYAIDKHNAYYKGQIVKGVDLKSFKVEQSGNQSGDMHRAKDKFRTYRVGKIIQDN